MYRGDGHEVLAIDEIDLAIRNKEFATILGPSGCGKSTLLRIVAGSGQADRRAWCDSTANAISGPGQDRGMVFQSYTLFPWLTVKENIQFGLGLSGVDQGRAGTDRSGVCGEGGPQGVRTGLSRRRFPAG